VIATRHCQNSVRHIRRVAASHIRTASRSGAILIASIVLAGVDVAAKALPDAEADLRCRPGYSASRYRRQLSARVSTAYTRTCIRARLHSAVLFGRLSNERGRAKIFQIREGHEPLGGISRLATYQLLGHQPRWPCWILARLAATNVIWHKVAPDSARFAVVAPNVRGYGFCSSRRWRE